MDGVLVSDARRVLEECSVPYGGPVPNADVLAHPRHPERTGLVAVQGIDGHRTLWVSRVEVGELRPG
jgi:hypothetical protein